MMVQWSLYQDLLKALEEQVLVALGGKLILQQAMHCIDHVENREEPTATSR